MCLYAKRLPSCPTLLRPYGPQPARLLCPWDSPGKNTGVGCHAFLQWIFSTQGLNLSLQHRQAAFFTTSATWETPALYSYIHLRPLREPSVPSGLVSSVAGAQDLFWIPFTVILRIIWIIIWKFPFRYWTNIYYVKYKRHCSRCFHRAAGID